LELELETLRHALHQAIDQLFDEYVATSALTQGVDADVVKGEDHGAFINRWPDGSDEKFTRARWYHVTHRDRKARALVAWTEREAWGRPRQRAVIFGESGSSLYPWTEFVETDDARFGAGIPDPANPRALLKIGAPIPDRFLGATVLRTDQLFHSVREGPSLRLVVSSDNEEEMVRHGYWVALIRGRL
jgi:hypothetical protein